MTRAILAFLGLIVAVGSAPAADLAVGKPVLVAEGPSVARPRAAYGAGSYLAVWRHGWAGEGGRADILARRLDPHSLRPLDPEPIPVCTADEAQDAPQVAFGHDLFLVAWEDFRNGRDLDIRARLIDARTGQPKGDEVLIAGGADNQCRPAVAATEEGFLVVWQDWRGQGKYGISARRLSDSGTLLGEGAESLADLGAVPTATRSGDRVLVSWVTGTPRGVTSGALLNARDGAVLAPLGALISCCPNEPAATGDGQGSFLVVSARASYPDPWGWGGPGAVVCARVTAEGRSPESKVQYGYRTTLLSERKVPNVVDAASWGKKPASKWDAGAVGGFPGTPDGLWPRGWPTAAHVGADIYLFAWVRGTISGDRLTLGDHDVWLRGMDAGSLGVRLPDRKLAGEEGGDRMRPALAAGPAGSALLLYEEIHPGRPRRVVARGLRLLPGPLDRP